MYKFSILVLGLAATLFSACGGGGAAITKHVPENAMAVGTFDMGILLKKANFERFSQTPEYKKALERAREPHRKYLSNPAETGIDVAATGAFYLQVTDEMGTKVNAVLILPMKDEAKFNQFFQAINDNKDFTEPVEKKGYKFSTPNSKVDELFMAWDKKIFIMGYVGGVVPSPEKELIIDRIFKPEGKSINDNADFARHAKVKKDIMFWASTDAYFKQLLAGETGPTVKMGLGFFGLQEADLTGNSITAYHDFQNGKWEGTADFTFSKGLKTQFGGIFKDKPSQTYEKYLPSDKLFAVLSTAVDLNQLYQVLEKRRLHTRIDANLENLKLTSKDLFNSLSGEGCIGIYPRASTETANNDSPTVPRPNPEDEQADSKDNNINPEDDNAEQILELYQTPARPEFNFVFVSGVKDVSPLNKILAMPEIALLVKKQGDIYAFNNPQNEGEKLYFFLSDKLLVASNMEEPALQAAKGGYANANLPASVAAQMNKGWASFYVNLATFYQQMAANNTNGLPENAFNETFGKEITDYSGFAQGTKATLGIELKSKDKNYLERSIELLIEASNK